ncbi:AraC family transcriptional regulator [Curtobacterium flaccumfaciens pv. flaccumfaciens]|uniref:AraC family transcriptional regulator n=1 Tax=Curtobacterium flaccumfaciens TaxID=2035 RepID=UPI00217DCAF6|nr:AraC family transcriptional regulator [Curtobacterium flaccumfaciens]MCS6586939.1 AraC family transcriptional regulator [Curtobacterium flaccumfaciens pv. flaccumfaciens]
MSESIRRTRQVAQTADPTVAAEVIARTHASHGVDVDPDGAGFVFEERVRGTRLLSLESTTCTGVVSGTIEPGSAMTLVWLKSGRGTVDGHPVEIGGPVLYRNGPQPVRFEAFQKDVIRIDRATVEAVAAERGGWAPGPLEFHPRHVPEGPTLAAWWLMIRTVAGEVLTGPDEVPVEREQELTRFAAAGLLTAIPHWLVEQPASNNPGRSRFARAEAFLLEHATEHITVADIAEVAGLSIRGTQAAFNRHHGTTPLAYLRRIRLHLAREQLQIRPDRSVAEIARGAGFAHLGRFAGAYRDEFGELPRHTQQAART